MFTSKQVSNFSLTEKFIIINKAVIEIKIINNNINKMN